MHIYVPCTRTTLVSIIVALLTLLFITMTGCDSMSPLEAPNASAPATADAHVLPADTAIPLDLVDAAGVTVRNL